MKKNGNKRQKKIYKLTISKAIASRSNTFESHKEIFLAATSQTSSFFLGSWPNYAKFEAIAIANRPIV